MSFKYDVLANNSFFRLLKLEPEDEDKCIKGTIETHPLDKAPEYEALSYVWGSPDRQKVIKCNGENFQITASLEAALKWLQSPYPRYLWVDQICIDQRNLTERKEQVIIMRDIFSNAKTVYGWLGTDELRQSVSAAELIYNIASHRQFTFTSYGNKKFPTNDTLVELGLPTRDSPAWGALNTMLSLPYFSRVWIIQEIVVSKNFVFIWGEATIPFLKLEAFRYHSYYYGMHMVDYIESPQYPGLCLPSDVAFPTKRDEPKDWLELVSMAAGHQATDNRDKIFASIGLANGIGYNIVPDYEKAETDVFVDFASQVISTSKNLKILSYCDVRNPACVEGPLWAPRWCEFSEPQLMHEGFKASDNSEIIRKVLPDTRILALKGVQIDSVKSVGKPLTKSRTHLDVGRELVSCSKLLVKHQDICMGRYGRDIVRPWVLTMMAGQTHRGFWLGVSDCPRDTYFDEFLIFIVSIFSTLLVHRDLDWDLARDLFHLLRLGMDAGPTTTEVEPVFQNPSTLECFGKFLNVVYQDDEDAVFSTLDALKKLPWIDRVHKSSFYDSYARATIDKKFFITETGYTGIGPPCIQPGDHVCTLFGGKVPYIVRPTSIPDEYLFLGDTYVHGLMYGDAETTRESSDPAEKWLYLR